MPSPSPNSRTARKQNEPTRESMSAIVGLALLLCSLVVCQPFSLTFTGNAEVDFPSSQNNNKNFAAHKYEILIVVDQADVGTPPMWKYKTPDGAATSGWDMKDVRFQYDYTNDALHMAINCFGICGDADADGDPSRTSAELQARGGQDLPKFAKSETCAIALDFGSAGDSTLDDSFDFVVGYPSGRASGSDTFPCSVGVGVDVFDTSCFGLYQYDLTAQHLGDSFKFVAADPALALARSRSLALDQNPTTSMMKPDVEWTLNKLNDILKSGGFAAIDSSGATPFAIGFASYCGSFQDDGIGEDLLPDGGGAYRLEFSCQFASEACHTTVTRLTTSRTSTTATSSLTVSDSAGTITTNNSSFDAMMTTTTTTPTPTTTIPPTTPETTASTASSIHFTMSLLVCVWIFV